MEGDSIISLEDEVTEFLLTWSEQEALSNEVVLVCDKTAVGEHRGLEGEDQGMEDRNVAILEEKTPVVVDTFLQTDNCRRGILSQTRPNPKLPSLFSSAGAEARVGRNPSVLRHVAPHRSRISTASQSSSGSFLYRSSYVEELKARWPTRYEKMKKEVDAAREKNM